MLRQQFSYHLPPHLIAKHPPIDRTSSRLLQVLPNGEVNHWQFHQINELLKPDDVLVLNNTYVIPARLFTYRSTGARVELFLHKIINPTTILAQIRSNRPIKPETMLYLNEKTEFRVVEKEDTLFKLELTNSTDTNSTWQHIFKQYGHTPIPPYLQRQVELQDKTRYQTVYAKHEGAVAAPTAGLHFDAPLLQQLREKGIDILEVTLHVGAGTFQPVRVDDVRQHKIHTEWMHIDDQTSDKINLAMSSGRRIVAVGTTSVRVLESAAINGKLHAKSGETNLFIYPGYQFQIVDAMITNFHLPESTLLMLVSAFSGQQTIMQAYQSAITNDYRFFSYGDAMLLTRH